MSEFVVAVLAFLAMIGAALLGLLGKTRLRSEQLQDDTRSVLLVVANLFVVMTSLVLGLMMNSAKNTFETNNRDIRTLATELILLDRTMRALGPEAEDARRHLVEYVQTSLKGANVLEEDPQAEASLEAPDLIAPSGRQPTIAAAYAFNAATVPTPAERERSTLGS